MYAALGFLYTYNREINYTPQPIIVNHKVSGTYVCLLWVKRNESNASRYFQVNLVLDVSSIILLFKFNYNLLRRLNIEFKRSPEDCEILKNTFTRKSQTTQLMDCLSLRDVLFIIQFVHCSFIIKHPKSAVESRNGVQFSQHSLYYFTFFPSHAGVNERWASLQQLVLFSFGLVALGFNGSWCWTCVSCWAPVQMVVMILKMVWQSQISQLDVDSNAYQQPNRGLIDAGFRKWDNRVRLVMAALPSFYFIA